MAELTQAEVVYSPRSLQLWRALLNWLAFFFQIFSNILRALGHHPLLSSSSSASTSTHAFKPLPVVELTETDFPDTLEIGAARDSVHDVASDERIQKLTVPFRFCFMHTYFSQKIYWILLLVDLVIYYC